jgi:hypothetical protein
MEMHPMIRQFFGAESFLIEKENEVPFMAEGKPVVWSRTNQTFTG